MSEYISTVCPALSDLWESYIFQSHVSNNVAIGVEVLKTKTGKERKVRIE